MKIVILGAGKVGGSLARNLSNSDYQVSIVDEDKLKLSALEERLDIMTVEGHAAKPNSIMKAGADEDTIVTVSYTHLRAHET